MSKKEVKEYWDNRWNERNIPWHQSDVNPFLVKYFDECCKKCCQGTCNAFLPLCGKAIELKWIAERGCNVVGVELSKVACEEFFTENNLTYNVNEISGALVYKCKELAITLYGCDFFEFTNILDKNIRFDFIWDRGSLGAVESVDRERYCGIISTLLKQNGSCLVESFVYDEDQYDGPPYNMPINILKDLYGQFYLSDPKEEKMIYTFLSQIRNSPQCGVDRFKTYPGDQFNCSTLTCEDWLHKSRKRSDPRLKHFHMCIYLVRFKIASDGA